MSEWTSTDAISCFGKRGWHRYRRDGRCGHRDCHGFRAASRRQYVVGMMQLGAQVTHPARGIPTDAAHRVFGFLEEDFDLGIRQQTLEAVERLVGRGIEHDQCDIGLRLEHRCLIGRGGIGFQHDIRAGLAQCFAHAVAGRTGAGQQHDAASAITHEDARSRAVRTRCASVPAPGTACPGNG